VPTQPGSAHITPEMMSDGHHSPKLAAEALMGISNPPRPTEEPKMTASLTKTIRQAGLMLAFAVSVSALSSTSSFAFSAEAQQMCTGDAFRLCSSEIPNIPRITACMVKQRANLSAGCRAVMDREAAQQSSKVATK
jgi:hypothetical protein